MSEIRYASLKHDLTRNLGDEIQTIASDRFIPAIDRRFERDQLATVEDKTPYLIVLNGWFSHSPDTTFPLADCLFPVITGFHIAEKAWGHIAQDATLEFLSKYAPIGCRDRRTAEMLSMKGIDVYYSKCVTLTLPKRSQAPVNGKIFVVDAQEVLLPKRMRKNTVYVTHRPVPGQDRLKQALALLDRYRDEASLVVTRRLHCALPCVAMGIPVIFLSDKKDYRVSVAGDVGLRIYRIDPFRLPRGIRGLVRLFGWNKYWDRFNPYLLRLYHYVIEQINWDPEPIDFEEEKAEMIRTLKDCIQQARDILSGSVHTKE